MNKVLIFIASLFILPVLAVVGKQLTDSMTENYTFASTMTSVNMTNYPWIIVYFRSFWWVIPIAAVVALVLWFMKRQEPEPYQPPPVYVPRMPKAPKPPKQKRGQQPPGAPPSIFLGGR